MTALEARRGLVLGAGGVLGAAWALGALAAVQEQYGWDPREAEELVGTSAGAVLAASLAAGVPVDALLRSTAPVAALSTVLPHGRGSVEPVGRLVDELVPPGAWAPHPCTWIVAMDHDSGRRVPFGRPGAPPAALRDAVRASCSVPGWYAPVPIGRARYVDGGACSPTSLDLVTRLGLAEVVVLSPTTSREYDAPGSVAARLERRFRRLVTKRLAREVDLVVAAGTRVTVLGPGPEDLAVIGANLMDPRRADAVLETSLRTSAAALRAQRLSAAG